MSLPNRTGRDSTPVHHRHSGISFGSAELDLVYVDKSHNFIANVENLTGHWDLSHPQEPPSRPHIRRFRFSAFVIAIKLSLMARLDWPLVKPLLLLLEMM